MFVFSLRYDRQEKEKKTKPPVVQLYEVIISIARGWVIHINFNWWIKSYKKKYHFSYSVIHCKRNDIVKANLQR